MAKADNKSVIRRLIEEGLNKRNPALIQETYSPEYLGHDPERPAPRTIADLQQGMLGLLGKVFPDGLSQKRIWWYGTGFFARRIRARSWALLPQGNRSHLAAPISFGCRMVR
jgi:hypothetical protein